MPIVQCTTMKSDGPTKTGTGLVKSLQKYGNSYALIVDKAVLDAMGIAPDTPLRITVQGDALTARPANAGYGPELVDQLMDEIERDYGRALKRLAE